MSTSRFAWSPSRSQPPARCATLVVVMRSRTTSSRRKFSATNSCRLAPSDSFRLGMIAVCGIGSPSGWRKIAVTANQSAIAPTMAASAPAFT